MAMKISIQPQLVFYEEHELEAWKNGDRQGVSDDYLRRLARGSTGFGEYVVGRHFEKLGYRYIHHDFDLFGTNSQGKYPKSEEVLRHLPPDKLSALRSLHRAFLPFRDEKRHPMETPDLLVYSPDFSELRFVECKREDTGDKVNHRQVVGLIAIATLLRCPVDVYVVRRSGVAKQVDAIEFTYGAAPGEGVRDPGMADGRAVP